MYVYMRASVYVIFILNNYFISDYTTSLSSLKCHSDIIKVLQLYAFRG